MKKTELVEQIATSADLSKASAERVLKSLLATVTQQLSEGEIVQLTGFGTFSLKYRPEREGRNPQTGDKMTIAAANIPSFKPGKALKDNLNS